jgi:hypothetical protein
MASRQAAAPQSLSSQATSTQNRRVLSIRNFMVISEQAAFSTINGALEIRISAMLESTRRRSEMSPSPEAAAIIACRLIRERRYAASNATYRSYLSLRRKDFLNADLVNAVLTTQVNQMDVKSFPTMGRKLPPLQAIRRAAVDRRFACSRLSQPCLPGSSSRRFRNAHHHHHGF